MLCAAELSYIERNKLKVDRSAFKLTAENIVSTSKETVSYAEQYLGEEVTAMWMRREAFVKEVGALSKLMEVSGLRDHIPQVRGIVTDMGKADGGCIVTGATGETLKNYVTRKRAEMKEVTYACLALRLTKQFLQILTTIHRNGFPECSPTLASCHVQDGRVVFLRICAAPSLEGDDKPSSLAAGKLCYFITTGREMLPTIGLHATGRLGCVLSGLVQADPQKRMSVAKALEGLEYVPPAIK